MDGSATLAARLTRTWLSCLGWARRGVVEGGDVEMALFSKGSKHTQPEQVKEASQSPGAQAFQSPASNKKRSQQSSERAHVALGGEFRANPRAEAEANAR